MATLSRKQREILARHELILDAADKLLHDLDYISLTMEKVAAEIEYAKGTVYQHFSCKEELLCALCLRHFGMLKSMFARAVQYSGNNRSRMKAVFVAYQLFFKVHNRQFMQMKLIKSIHIRHKVSAETQKQIMDAELECHQVLGEVAINAIQQGELDLKEMKVPEFLFGLWSSAFGGMMLQATDIPMSELGINNADQTLRQHMTKILDGYNWLPLSKDHDVDAEFKAIEKEIFSEEMNLLKSKGL